MNKKIQFNKRVNPTNLTDIDSENEQGSVFDILGNLLKTLDNDDNTNHFYEKSEPNTDRKDTIIGHRGEKRKRIMNEIEKNNDGKFLCKDCDYQMTVISDVMWSRFMKVYGIFVDNVNI